MFYDNSVTRINDGTKTITLLSLAVPSLLENISVQLYGTFNTLILSGFSEIAVTAVGMSEQIINVIINLVSMIIKGAVIVASVYLGSSEREKAGKITSTALSLVLFFSILICSIASIFSQTIIGFTKLEGIEFNLTVSFFRLRSLFVIVTIVMSFFNNMLICNGYAKQTMITTFASNFINIGISYAFLYGKLWTAAEGTTPVAVAGVIAQTIGLFLSIIFFVHKKCPFKLSFKIKYMLKILKVGIPSGMAWFAYSFSQMMTTGFLTIFGPLVVNAKVYISNIVIYASGISMALGQGILILNGYHKGAGNIQSIKKLSRQTLGIAVLFNTILAIIIFILRRPLLSLFTSNKEIFAISATILLLEILVDIFRAFNHILENSLNAVGDVKATFAISVFSGGCLNVLGAYLFGVVLGLGLNGIWIAFILDEGFKSISYYIRWKKEKWINIQI